MRLEPSACIACELCETLAPDELRDPEHIPLSAAALDAMAACPTGAIRWKETDMQLDVRTIIPRERHPLIFSTFDQLELGESFELVNDHDPKPLYYQLQAERAGQLEWHYLEEGPEVWRVRIGRV